MRKTILIGLVLAVALGGLFMAKAARAPKKPPLNTQQIQARDGIPVRTSTITNGDMEQTVEVTGDIDALDKVMLSAKIAGRVSNVYKREGEGVSLGETIITLDQQDLLSNLQAARGGLETAIARLSQAKTNSTVTKIQTDSAIEQAQAQLNQAQAHLAVVKQPNRSQERLVAENAVAEAKARLDNAEADYKRNKSLVQQGAIAQSSFDVVDSQYRVAKTQYESAVQRLSLVKEGGRFEDIQQAQAQVLTAKEALRSAKANASQNMLRKEDIKQAQAALEQAKASVALAEQQLSYSYIKSPISGMMSSRLTEPGQVISPGQALGEVVDLGSIFFKGDVSENSIADVHKGQNVRVTIDAIPGKTFAGHIDEIYPAGSTTSRNFPVRIGINDTSHTIRPGMFARGEIIIGVEKNIMLVPKDAVDQRKGTQSVFTVGQDKTVKRHIVTVVRENRDYVQIQTPSDLKEGDVVVTEGRQNLQDGTKIQVIEDK